MDGIETARQIRKRIGKEITIIVLTSYEFSEIEEEAKAAGHRCFYCKTAVPFPADGYTAAVYFRKKRKYSKKLSGEAVRIRLHGKKDSAG